MVAADWRGLIVPAAVSLIAGRLDGCRWRIRPRRVPRFSRQPAPLWTRAGHLYRSSRCSGRRSVAADSGTEPLRAIVLLTVSDQTRSWHLILWSLLLFAGCFSLHSRDQDFPFFRHPDEPGKVEQV